MQNSLSVTLQHTYKQSPHSSVLSRLFCLSLEYTPKLGTVPSLKATTSHVVWAIAFAYATHCVKKLPLFSATVLCTRHGQLSHALPSVSHSSLARCPVRLS